MRCDDPVEYLDEIRDAMLESCKGLPDPKPIFIKKSDYMKKIDGKWVIKNLAKLPRLADGHN